METSFWRCRKVIDITKLKALKDSDKFANSELAKELESTPDQLSEQDFLTLLPVWLRIAGRSK